MERNVLKERLMNKDDKNRHFVLLIIDISKHGAKEMGHVKMAGPGFVNAGRLFHRVPAATSNLRSPYILVRAFFWHSN
jgi:hypothetical protein